MELPEVENIKNGLLPLVGQRLNGIEIFLPKVALPSPEELKSTLTGRTLLAVKRRGKYLIFTFSKLGKIGKERPHLVLHLKMTGQLLLYQQKRLATKHTRAILYFSKAELHFNDVRTFGFLKLVKDKEVKLPLGPEPLANLTLTKFNSLIKKKRLSKRPLKSHLLDQTFLAGLGNIYADEVLFRAKLNPLRLLKSLSKQEIALLHQSLTTVLKEAIAAGGTTFADYRNTQGEKGAFYELLKVYQRADQPCFNCGTIIQKLKIAGRSSYFCPACQKGT